MNDGDAVRPLPHPSRPWCAALVLIASATIMSACGASGGGNAASDDAPETTTTQVEDQAAGPAEGGAGGEVVSCFDLEPPAWTATPTDADLPFEIVGGKAPGLTDGAPTGQPDTSTVYKTADEFLAQSNVPDPAARKVVMQDAGYKGGAEGEWTTGNGFTMQALSFANAPAAASYVQARLPSICGQGGTQDGVTMLDDGDGIMWLDPLGATHGEFIFGGSQISLTSCGGCDVVSLDEMQAWHDAFVEAYATGPAAPIS